MTENVVVTKSGIVLSQAASGPSTPGTYNYCDELRNSAVKALLAHDSLDLTEQIAGLLSVLTRGTRVESTKPRVLAIRTVYGARGEDEHCAEQIQGDPHRSHGVDYSHRR